MRAFGAILKPFSSLTATGTSKNPFRESLVPFCCAVASSFAFAVAGSDGVPEAMDEELNEFTMRQMMEIIELGQTQSLDDSVVLLENSVKRWCVKNGPKDDVPILACEITPEA